MRVLIATVTAGGGHLAAAAALEEAWQALRPQDSIECIDLLKFSSALQRNLHSDAYVRLVEHAPELWGMLFKKTDEPAVARRLNRIKRAVPSTTRSRFIRHVKRSEPDVVLCTHYLPLEMLAGLRQKHAQSAPFVASVVTDFEAHALWMEEGVDLYCVAAEETRVRLIARGAAPERVEVTGIPIASRFTRLPSGKSIRIKLGVRDDLPIVLVLSGGFGMGPVGEILMELDKVGTPLQTVVVTGRNVEMRRELAAQDRAHPTHILGFAGNMHELMSVADLIITKPGGLTTSEALALGKPILILNPIPGQEAANSDFLLERGAAAKVNRAEDIPYRIKTLLGSDKLAAMGRAAKELGRPRAAIAVCEAVLGRTPQLLK